LLTTLMSRLWRPRRAGPNVSKASPLPGSDEPAGARRNAYTGTLVTDEHFVPSFGLDLETYIARTDATAVHHLVRYLWAAAVLAKWGARGPILDLGCGSGYGAYLLAKTVRGAEVLGLDHDEAAIRNAQETYCRRNLAFRPGDPLVWSSSIGDDAFETIVMFDVLEHVRHREILLESVVRHLAPRGRLLLSTPSAACENDLEPGWPHHRIEYGTASLYDLLRRYFAGVLGSDREDFPERAIFTKLSERGISYLLRLNPVICTQPIRIENPYRAMPG
jgi:SAM-dependent methyltransferase